MAEHYDYYLDSKNRNTATDSPNSFTITLPDEVPNQIKGYQVLYYDMPNSVTNVNSTNSDFFITEDPGGTPSTSTVSITDGNYTGTTLAAEIETQLKASTLTSKANFTCDYSTTLNTLTIAVSGGATFQIDFSNAATSDETYLLLGFNQNATTTDAASATSTRGIDLTGLAYVVVNIREFGDRHYVSSTGSRGQIFIPLSDVGWTDHAISSDADETYTHRGGMITNQRTWNIEVLYNGSVAPIQNEWRVRLRLFY